MSKKEIYIGEERLKFADYKTSGEIIDCDGEEFYRISNFDKMEPFLVSLASSSDHWLYISSLGGLTAGRKNADNALFPYVTDDKLHDESELTGSKTILKVMDDKSQSLWEPFTNRYDGIYRLKRNIFKNISCTKIFFEEINEDLGLVFKYGWTTSDKFGFIKFSEIKNISSQSKKVEVLDGIQNILAAGIFSALQSGFSTLVNGYKKNELIEETGVGLFSLSSLPSDRPQPSESLKCTSVFSFGINPRKILLSSQQISRFRRGFLLEQETSVKGIKAAYFVNSEVELKPGEWKSWCIVSEINQNSGSIIALNERIAHGDISSEVEKDIETNREKLIKLIAQADGLQYTENKRQTARHFSNVLFNVMRGGVFADAYRIEKKDFVLFLDKANPYVLKAHREFIDSLPENFLHAELMQKAEELKDSHFYKLALEYLPLVFSRRHGDPSRPWNQFSIDLKDENGEKKLNYQGNWRDIFQNWEALSLSYPDYLESMIAKFLNNTTADGYNPYRIFRDGFDWEDLEPDNPWANIGYWGDHQVIYLLKLLEWLNEYRPQSIEKMTEQEIFSFANVPYRIKSYDEIVMNPRATIEFDFELNEKLRRDEELYGSDAKYLKNNDQTLTQVNLADKLLITLLVKLSNFVPGGGIWLNTQRPEWNDANNAIVGNGLSMVTLYYLRRFLGFLLRFLGNSGKSSFEIAGEVRELFEDVFSVLRELAANQEGGISDVFRKKIVDELGTAGSKYREKIYDAGIQRERTTLAKKDIRDFIELSIGIIDSTIAENKRDDMLYHSYNVLSIKDDEMSISHLYEMLEGQVGVLSSGYLAVDGTIELLSALRHSSLYREDQNSYILYPNKELPEFTDKNNVNPETARKSELLKKLMESNNTEILYRDFKGGIHFQGDLLNAEALSNRLDKLAGKDEFHQLIHNERTMILDIYEETFDHKTFTGRANTFYKYEGLGSIYWHMVSKLLLAVEENFLHAQGEADAEQIEKLKHFYYDIKDGIGTEKSPDEYGAFTTDPYSHTPSFCGVQQPGMTGQVKEDIISRFCELGVKIHNSKIVINPGLLNRSECTKSAGVFIYYDVKGEKKELHVEENSIVFTYCQVPFVYKLSGTDKIVLNLSDGKEVVVDGLEIDEDLSREIFSRSGKVEKVEVAF